MKRLTIRELKKIRWAISRQLKMLRSEDVQRFVGELGFVTVSVNKMFPSLAGAIYSSDLASKFEIEQRLWDFAHLLISNKKAFYGKLFKSRPMLTSMDLLPAILRLHPIPDYKKLYNVGRLTGLGTAIIDLLFRAGPLMTIELKHRLKIHNRRQRDSFENEMARLQQELLICCIGKIAHCKCRWRFKIWALTSNWLPQQIKSKAKRLNREEAMRNLIDKFIYSTIQTDTKAIARFFNWPMPDTAEVVETMQKRGLIEIVNANGKVKIIKRGISKILYE